LKINEFGHKCPNIPLPIGGAGEMDAEKLSFKIVEKCVE
jgi:muramoyltetrapeptide carboxypeptidase LdcA involved in peptidoglycan recycling